MRHKIRPAHLGVLIVGIVAAMNFGCGGGSASTLRPPPPISVSLSQTTATVQAGATAQFTATLSNDSANRGVTWTVSCSVASCGTVSPNSTASGTATTYTAPVTPPSSDLMVTLTATSVADTTKSASVAITVPSVSVSVSGTIAVGTAPNAIAVDSTTNKIYVTDFGSEGNDGICQTCYCPGTNGSLTVIDGTTQSPTTTGFSYAYSNPLDLAVNPANHSLYVASRVFFTVSPTCGYGGVLGVFDTTTLSQTATSDVGSALFGVAVAVNQNTGNVYLADWHDGRITVFDGSGNLLHTITLAARPSGVAVNTTTNKIYVATNYASNDVIVIDGATNSLVITITDPNIVAPVAIAVNPATDTVYVANGQSCSGCPAADSLTVVDGASGSVTGTIPVGSGPSSIAVDPQTNFIYVANAGNYDFNQHGSVSVINGATKATNTLTDPNLTYPFRIAVNPTTNKIYVASLLSNNVTVIDGAR